MKNNSKTIQQLTISAFFMALYIVIMLQTQSFAFGQYQIRIATALYAMSAIFPFLAIPLALANCVSNTLMGGLGILDMVGGGIVGYLTCQAIIAIRAMSLPRILLALPIIIVPGLLVPVWLSVILNIPYLVLMPLLVVGQIAPGVVGAVVVSVLERVKVVAEYTQTKQI